MSIAWNLHPRLDRLGEVRRDDDALARLWQLDSTRLLLVDARGGVALADGGELRAEPTSGSHDPTRDVLLGRLADPADGGEGTVWFARRGEVSDGHTLREVDVDSGEVELVTAATAVLAWHDASQFCERCGAPSVMAAGGFQRRCTGCSRELFPRTDPAMIVAVLDDDERLLLAHQASWAEGRVSILAGFLEAGESAEHAVVREVREESGLDVQQVRYLASQPWPYPRSLMLGFVARASGEVRVDGEEIEWATWYTRDELTAAQQGGVQRPGLGSIAGRIIEAWRTGELGLASIESTSVESTSAESSGVESSGVEGAEGA